ncbi:NAD(P)-binding protein (Fragment) [Madurella fahalii]|uniref:NAD(P)-binding protein n=1 Tax=Madurella fahalii TaxID=1157608 RepID=A0ABQ0G503_9PEZI
MPADPTSDKLLFTVGAGKQSIALLSILVPNWKNIRLGVRSDASATRLADEFPSAEIVRADLNDIKSVEELVKGVNVIYHFGPSLHPREADLGVRVVDAAGAENRRNPGAIKHFVFSSIAGPQIRKLPNHACKGLVEEALMESGLPYTILQPGFRMDAFPLGAVLGQRDAEDPGGTIIYKSAWRPEVATSFVTLRDQSEAARVVLEERERHFYATYQLVSTPAPMPYTEFVERAVGVAGKKVEVGYKGFEEAVAFYLDILFGSEEKADPEVRDGLQRTLLYYNHRGLLGSSTQLEWLIGRKGQSVEEWARTVLGPAGL